MSLIFHHDFAHPPKNINGNRAVWEIYGQRKDGSLKHMPPIWILRGWIERHDVPITKHQFDAGYLNVPTDPVLAEKMRKSLKDETFTLNKFLSPAIIGCKVEINDVLIHVYLAVLDSAHQGRGYAGHYLDSLSKTQTQLFTEVLPQTKMPGMLERRGYKPIWVADSEDELGIYFPCYVRWGNGEN